MNVFIFLAISIFSLLLHTEARADIINNIFRIECIPELNTLTISNRPVNGRLPEALLKSNDAALAEKYGIHGYLDKILVYSDNFSHQITKTYETHCSLRTKDSIQSTQTEDYIIKVTGLVETANPGGRCGGWSSFSLSLFTNDKALLTDIPFDESCESPRLIKQISFWPHEGYFKVEGEEIPEDNVNIKDTSLNMEDFYPSPASK